MLKLPRGTVHAATSALPGRGSMMPFRRHGSSTSRAWEGCRYGGRDGDRMVNGYEGAAGEEKELLVSHSTVRQD